MRSPPTSSSHLPLNELFHPPSTPLSFHSPPALSSYHLPTTPSTSHLPTTGTLYFQTPNPLNTGGVSSNPLDNLSTSLASLISTSPTLPSNSNTPASPSHHHTPTNLLSMLPSDFTLTDDVHEPTQEDRIENMLFQIKGQLDELGTKFGTFESRILERLSRLEAIVSQELAVPSRQPLAELNRTNTTPLKPRPQISSDVHISMQGIASNLKYTTGVQLGMALAKELFTEHEMATCTLTGKTVK